MTVSDLIASTMRLLGWLAPGEVQSAEESAHFLTVLNQMLASWNTEGLSVYARQVQPCQLTGVASYTIGTGGVFNVARPVAIEGVVAISGTLRLPVKPINALQWAEIRQRALVGAIPEVIYADYAYPLMNLNFAPISLALTELTVLTPLQVFAAITDVIALPNGYEEAIRTNLAVRLAPEMGALDPTIAALSVASKQAIQQFNARVQGLSAPQQAQA